MFGNYIWEQPQVEFGSSCSAHHTPELLVLELDCLLTHCVEEGAVMANNQQRLALTTRGQIALQKHKRHTYTKGRTVVRVALQT